MPSYFQIRLDTTAPQGPVFELAGGAGFVATQDVSFVLTTTDADKTGYQIKLWGDVDLTYNPAIQDTKAASGWLGYGTIGTLRLSAPDGLKTIHAVIRDDVGNETATLDDAVTMDISLPVITITVDPDRSVISKVDPWDDVYFTFVADSDISNFWVKVVPNPASTLNQGIFIPMTNGSTTYASNFPATVLAAGVPREVRINGADLQDAAGPDGNYYVKVFGQETTTGFWSV